MKKKQLSLVAIGAIMATTGLFGNNIAISSKSKKVEPSFVMTYLNNIMANGNKKGNRTGGRGVSQLPSYVIEKRKFKKQVADDMRSLRIMLYKEGKYLHSKNMTKGERLRLQYLQDVNDRNYF